MTNVFTSLQNLSKSAASFSWALSVFGISQAGKVARGIPKNDPGGEASESFEKTTAAIKGQLDNLRGLFEVGNQVVTQTAGAFSEAAAALPAPPAAAPGCAGNVGAPPNPAPNPQSAPPPSSSVLFPNQPPPSVPQETAHPDSYKRWEQHGIIGSQEMEEVFISFSRGSGYFSEDLNPPIYINLLTDMFDMDANWIGYQAGVNKTFEPPEASLSTPAMPPLPINGGEVPEIKANGWTKAMFTFNDGAMNVNGPAITHLIPLETGDLLFMVTTSHVITSGTGAYEGARGTKQATGTGLIPKALYQAGKFPSPGLIFPVTTVETFRLIRKQYLIQAVN